MIDHPNLPEGWTSEPIGTSCIAITRTGNELMFGAVTVDFAARVFRSGWSSGGRATSTAKYNGRGWRARLVADAVKCLSDVHKEQP